MYEVISKKWSDVAWKLPETPPRLPRPFAVLTGESVDVVRACQRNWTPVSTPDGTLVRPGLLSAVGGGGQFTAETLGEILELKDALQAAQTRYRLLVDSAGTAPVERAQFLLSEMQATLEWLFEDGQETEGDAQLAQLAETHEDAMSQDAIAAALYDYAALAERQREKLEGLGGFSSSLIDEARLVVEKLREHSAGPAARGVQAEIALAFELRNRLGELLYSRMLIARAAMRFVFRRHPEVAREAGSAYERRGRARRRQSVDDAPSSGVSDAAPSTESLSDVG